jgi:hypothetical protein
MILIYLLIITHILQYIFALIKFMLFYALKFYKGFF